MAAGPERSAGPGGALGWLVNIDHLYWVRDGLAVAQQKLHPTATAGRL